MNSLTRIAAGAVATAALGAAAAPPAEPLRSATRSFTIHLQAAPAATVPLFGPVRETEWSPEWNPAFVHPAAPAQVEGAVFKTDGPHPATWVLSRFDERAGEVEYHVFIPEFALTRIAIRVTPGAQVGTSKATVTYRRTALATEANSYIADFEQHFEAQGAHWEGAINAALAKAAR